MPNTTDASYPLFTCRKWGLRRSCVGTSSKHWRKHWRYAWSPLDTNGNAHFRNALHAFRMVAPLAEHLPLQWLAHIPHPKTLPPIRSYVRHVQVVWSSARLWALPGTSLALRLQGRPQHHPASSTHTCSCDSTCRDVMRRVRSLHGPPSQASRKVLRVWVQLVLECYACTTLVVVHHLVRPCDGQ